VQFVLLASLWWLADHSDEPPTQRQLAEQAGTDPMMTSQVVRKLEARGLVTRALDERDTRARRLRLTDEGGRVLAGALADVEAVDATVFGAVGAADRAALVRALGTLASDGEGGGARRGQ
jgi:DNA-binding MarR family transcriptional regulator